ncbi:hypothetical protein [Natronoglomus mannanivorans]|uniref:Uncharacterized protein n=1 Tax=Natronoglomus mannanivorans TaxID=2979990 RepID=A0AAP2Z206_9EURY|nr:hypothetical protein [Halobacteria archaeon AArc-xg1-1]
MKGNIGATITVESYADVAADRHLHDDDPQTVARELNEHGLKPDWIIAWVPGWVLEDKSIGTVDGSAHIISGRVDEEREKAICVVVGRAESWLPKSQIRIYRRVDPDGPLWIPQGDRDAEEVDC